MAKSPAMRPGSGGGPIQNAKAQSAVKQTYGKGKAATKTPAKKPGVSRDDMKSRKGSPFAKKK